MTELPTRCRKTNDEVRTPGSADGSLVRRARAECDWSVRAFDAATFLRSLRLMRAALGRARRGLDQVAAVRATWVAVHPAEPPRARGRAQEREPGRPRRARQPEPRGRRPLGPR